MRKTVEFHLISEWAQAFLFDRRVQGFTAGTVTNYANKLRRFQLFGANNGISTIESITPTIIRDYLALLERDGLTVITRHGHYAAVKTWLRWYESEEEPESWSNPIEKIKPPKLPNAPIQPISMAEALKIVDRCPADLQGLRDKAILLTLIDTGIRASELLQLDIDDFNQVQGSLLIRHGKGDKTRTVYAGKKARKTIRSYLAQRQDDADALFVSIIDNSRLTYSGLRWIVLNRSRSAKVKMRGIHTFRRLYALTMLRNGVDVITLSRLMGHSDLQVLTRYLAQTDDDLREAHARSSPVDNAR